MTSRYYSNPAEEDLRCLLDGLQLPEPQDGEFLRSNSGMIFFHPTAGVSLRVEKIESKEGLPAHPLVSAPLGIWHVGDWQFELCEGLRTSGISMSDVKWVEQALSRDGFDWYDAKASNTGRISLASDTFPYGLPVVLDRESIYPLRVRGIFNRLAHTLKRWSEPARKFEDYGVPEKDANAYRAVRRCLTITLEAAMKYPSSPNQALVSEFWRICEQHTAPLNRSGVVPGELYRDWSDSDTGMSTDDKSMGARSAAQKYRQRVLSAAPA